MRIRSAHPGDDDTVAKVGFAGEDSQWKSDGAGWRLENALGAFEPVDDGSGNFVDLRGNLFQVAGDGKFVATVTNAGVFEDAGEFPVLKDGFGVAHFFFEECDDAERHEAIDEPAELVESG